MFRKYINICIIKIKPLTPVASCATHLSDPWFLPPTTRLYFFSAPLPLPVLSCPLLPDGDKASSHLGPPACTLDLVQFHTAARVTFLVQNQILVFLYLKLITGISLHLEKSPNSFHSLQMPTWCDLASDNHSRPFACHSPTITQLWPHWIYFIP